MPKGKAKVKRSSSFDNRQRGQSEGQSLRQSQIQSQGQRPKMTTEEMLNAVAPMLTEQQMKSFLESSDAQQDILASEWYESLQEKQVGEEMASQNLSRGQNAKTKTQSKIMNGMSPIDQQAYASVLSIYEQIKKQFPTEARKVAAR
jgi:hypothetical protein